jgi:hypothetical protein
MSFIVLLITGCGYNKEIAKEKLIYNEMLNKIDAANDNDYNHPLSYNINVYIDKIIESEIRYQVIIDDPKEEIKNISSLVTHNYPTEDIFPSIGIFDDKVNLFPNFIDKKNNYVKGISLIGYIPFEEDISEFDGVFKVIVEYEDELGNSKTDYYEYQN